MSGVYRRTTTSMVDDDMVSKTSHIDRNKCRKIGFLVALLATCFTVALVALLWTLLGSSEEAGNASDQATTVNWVSSPKSGIPGDVASLPPLHRSGSYWGKQQPRTNGQVKRCSCSESPPILDPPTSLQWDGQRRKIGGSVLYTCNGTPQVVTFKAICSASCKWQLEFIQLCPIINPVTTRSVEPNCHIDDIPTPTSSLRMQLSSRLNETVDYVCGPSANPIVIQQAICSEDGEWELVNKATFVQLAQLHCRKFQTKADTYHKHENSIDLLSGCAEDPPSPLDHIHMRWNSDQHIGAAVQYSCINWQDNPEIIATGVCSSYLEWELSTHESWAEIAEKHCTCQRSLPVPLWPIRIDGAFEKFYSSVVKYVCGSTTQPVRVQTAVCTPPGVWEFAEPTTLDVLSLKYCNCGELPNAPSAVSIEWDGESHVGATAQYTCSLGDRQFVIQRVTCFDDLTWRFIKKESWDTIISTSCTCMDPPPQAPPALKLKWDTSNNTFGSIAVYICDSTEHPVFVQMIQCLPPGIWDKMLSSSLETLAMKHCSCSEPPKAPPPLSLVQHNDRRIGAKISYVCDETQGEEHAVQVAVCTDKLDWQLSYPLDWMEITEKHCTCKDLPPLPPPPIRFQWDRSSSKFGTVISYTCGVNTNVQSTTCMPPGLWIVAVNSSFEALSIKYCSCSEGPPQPSLNTLSLHWEGEKLEGKTAYYKCNWKGDPNLNVVVKVAVCSKELNWHFTNKKSWKEISTTHCTCHDTPPLPPLPLKLEWVPSNNTVGKTATYTCGTASSPIIVQTAQCIPGGRWKLSTDMIFDALITKYCICVQDPPRAPQPIIAQWNGNRRIGSTVHYACNGEDEPDVILTAVCTGALSWKLSASLSWKSLIARHCKCKAAPPLPPKPLRIEQEIYNAYGTTINYICGPNEKPVIVQTAYCSAAGKWELANDHKFEELASIYCKCDRSPPKPPPLVIAKWDGEQHFGSIVKYHCDSEMILSTLQTAICNATLQWEMMADVSWSETFNQHCMCKEEPLPPPEQIFLIKPASRSFGSVAKYLCEFSDVDIIVQTAVCTPSGKWQFTIKNSLDELLTSRCLCSSDPPEPPHDVVMQWDGRRMIGSAANYECQWSHVSYPVQVVVCSPSTLTWEFNRNETWEKLVSQNCECLDVPPNNPEATITDWDGSVRRMGTQLIYHCKNSRAVVVAMTVYCSANKTWEIQYDTFCGCLQEPPELEFPVERIWDGLTRDFGTRIQYFCSRSHAAPVFQEAFCNDSRVWEIEIFGSCECKEHPLPPPEPLQLLRPENNSFGSIANYMCGDGENTIIVRSAVCSLSGEWQLSTESSFKEIIWSKCVCPEDPLPPPEQLLLIKPPNNLFGTVANYLCEFSDVDIIVQTAVCKTSGKWQFTAESSFDKLLQRHCLCNDDPPDPPHKVALNWNGTRLIGSSAHYECHWEEVSYRLQTVVCSPTSLTWEFKKNGTWEQLLSETCECQEMPPVHSEASISNWDGYARRMGMQLIYNCKKSKEFVVAMVVTCSANKTWEVEYDIRCGCSEDPPELNFPIERIWDGRTKDFGTRVKYLCSSSHSAPVFQEASCSDTRVWEVEVFSACVCEDPPFMSTELLKLHAPINNSVGSIANYVCGIGENAIVVQSAVCSPLGKWQFSAEHTIDELIRSKCVCADDPPSPPQHVQLRWDGSRLANASVQYECQWEDVVYLVQTAVCSSSTLRWEVVQKKTWEELIVENCECADPPPPDPEYAINNWNGINRRMGTQIVYNCENSQKPIVAKVVYCSVSRLWKVEYEESCGCSEDPPEMNDPIMRSWDGHSKGFHTGVKYYCTDNHLSPVHQEVICNDSRAWEIKVINSCVCADNPPKPPLHILQQWDGRRFINATVQYECKWDEVTYTVQTAVCSPITVTWEFMRAKTWKELVAENCECTGTPPRNSEFARSDWNGVDRRMGTQIVYNCENSLELVVAMIVYCSASKLWKVEYDEFCGCSEDPPEMNNPVVRLWDGQSNGFRTRVKYFCTDDHMSPVFQEAICNDSRVWEINVTSSCDCTTDPPVALLPATNDWDNDTRHVGTNVTYFCSEQNTKAIQKVVQCGFHLQWETVVEYSCYCFDEPPMAPFPVELVWNNRSTYIGTSVAYRCSANALSPVFQWATCSYTKEWELEVPEDLLTSYAKRCQCLSDPPLPPSPAIRQWNKTLNFIGSRVTYICSEDFASPEFQWATCNYIKEWEFDVDEDFSTLMSAECECKNDPPQPRFGLKWDWNPNVRNIGSGVKYYCGPKNKTTLTALTATCWQERTWKLSSEKAWLELIAENCECPDAPKTDDERIEVSWDGHVKRVGSVVYYWCDYELEILQKKLICTENRTWETLYNKSCDLPWTPLNLAETTVEATSILANTTTAKALVTATTGAPNTTSTELREASPPTSPTFASLSTSVPVTLLYSSSRETTSLYLDTDEPGHFCWEGWDSLSGEMCLLVQWELFTNDQAQATCMALGATLLEIYRKAEDDLVNIYLRSKLTHDYWFWHVGFFAEQLSMYWRSGHPFGSYSNFQSKMLGSTSSGRQCGAVSLAPSFSWMDVGCEDEKAAFICRPNYDFLGYSVVPFKPSKTRTKFGSITDCLEICKEISPFASLQDAVCRCFNEIPDQIQTLITTALERPQSYECDKLIPCKQITGQMCGCKSKAAIYMSGFAVLAGCFEGNDDATRLEMPLTTCITVCVAKGRVYALHESLNNMCACSNKLMRRNTLLPFDECHDKNLQQPISKARLLTQIYRLPSTLGKDGLWIPSRKTKYSEVRMADHDSSNNGQPSAEMVEISESSAMPNDSASVKGTAFDTTAMYQFTNNTDVIEVSNAANESALVLSQVEDDSQTLDSVPPNDKDHKKGISKDSVQLAGNGESPTSSATTVHSSFSITIPLITVIATAYMLFG